MGDVRFKYTIFYGLVLLLLVVSIAGLLLKRKWGFQLALASNVSFTLLPIALLMASVIMLPTLPVSELISHSALNLVAGGVSLFFWMALVLGADKEKCVV